MGALKFTGTFERVLVYPKGPERTLDSLLWAIRAGSLG